MKNLKIMEKSNRFFLLTVAITILAIVGILIPTVNKTASNFGGYRLSYSYSLTAEPLPEGTIGTDVTTLFPNMTVVADIPVYAPIDMTEVKSTVESVVNGKVTVIDTPEKELTGSNVVTFEIRSSSYPSDTLVTNLSQTLTEKFPDYDFQSTSVTPVSGLFTQNFMLCVAITAILIIVLLCLWFGFRFSDISGWNVGLLAAVDALFVLIITTSIFILSGLPIGNNYLYVSMAMLIVSVVITMIGFQYLQDESPALSKSNLYSVLDGTISKLLKKSLLLCVVAILAIIVGAIAGATGSLGEVPKLALPVGGALIASIFITLFFALPFWGTSLEIEEEPVKTPAKSSSKKKKKAKQVEKAAEKSNDDEDFGDFVDSEAARLAVEQGGAKAAAKTSSNSNSSSSAKSSTPTNNRSRSKGSKKGGKKKKRR